jgi:two-component system response regulator HydG
MLTLERATEHRQLRREVKRLRAEVDSAARVDDLIGESRPMRRVYELIAQLGDGESTVLITGESGTGKELVARAIHRKSRRADGPFVAINCAAMPASLLESELFGHVRGAFTDAKRSREGLFVQASNGTLFLDEIGEMAIEMQAKLLRVLQERRVRPVGGDAEIEFDSRIISATNRDLEEEVSEGRFREDLFYRINVINIPVPPLRSRGSDILLLAQAFLEQFAQQADKGVQGISAAAAQKLRDYDWPGNVRELENCLERAVTLTRFDEITVEDLPEALRNYQPRSMVIPGDDPEQMPTLEETERRYICRVLDAVKWNKSHAARVLGMDRRTLYRKIDRLGIDEPG